MGGFLVIVPTKWILCGGWQCEWIDSREQLRLKLKPRCLSTYTGLLHMFFQFWDVGDVILLASWDSNSNMSICDHQEPLKDVGFNGISCCFRKMFTIHLSLAQNYVSTEPQNLPHPQAPHYIPPNPLTCGPWGKWHTHWLSECQVKTYTKTH